MKILFMTFPLAFQSPGGGEQIILQARDALIAQGAVVDLFDPWNHKIVDYDVIHFFSSLNWWDWKTVKIYNKPLALTPTSWPAKGLLSKQLDLAKGLLKSRLGSREAYSLRNYYSFPDIFFPTTSLEGELLEKYYNIPQKKMKVIGNGVNPPRSIPMNENNFLRQSSFSEYILFAGSIRPNKNVDTLIQACQKLECKLVVMGESSFDTREYETHCRALAGEETLFVGHKENGSRDYDEIFNGSKIVANPSDFETFCLASAEGAAIGKPVIVPTKGGAPSVFQKEGFYVSNGKSITDLVQTITQVNTTNLEDLEARTSILSQRILKHFSWSNVASELLTSYRAIV